MASREEFVVDTSALPVERILEVGRFALAVVAEDARTFETDLPFDNASTWPDPVMQAADHLARRATGRRGRGSYMRTGVIPASDPQDWAALVCFAPYAFDATVWAADHSMLASLSDEGISLVVGLTSAQRRELEGIDDEVRLVPSKRRRRRR